MDATTLGVICTLAAGLIGSVVVYLGKRGENATARFNSVTDQVQEERALAVAERDAAWAESKVLREQRHMDLLEITRLRIKVIELGGEP